ncbi:hypothetical protein ACSBR2_022442 [Camellia fascicularis]
MGKNEACGFGVGVGVGVGHVVAKKWERGCCDDDDSDWTELTRDHFAGMRSVGVQRKKRMPRQRRSSLNLNLNLLLLPFPSLLVPHVPSPPSTRLNSSENALTPDTRNLLKNMSVVVSDVISLVNVSVISLHKFVIDGTRLRFLFQKELQTSDVGSLKRMIVPKKAAEDYLPTLTEKEGFFMRMDDMDGLHVWSFKFRYWPNNTSRMYVLENTGEFVNTHALKQGDYMMMYQDQQNQNFVIRGRKASDQDIYIECTMNGVNDYCPDDFEVNNNDSYHQPVRVNFPTVDDTTGPLPFVYDQTPFSSDLNRSYVYETTLSSASDSSYVYETTVSNETLLDFWNAPMTYNPKVVPIGNFESIENSSMEELLLSF